MNKAELPRNWRNNNPLNIRRTKDRWQGLSEEQKDRAFCQFSKVEYGWRAAFMLLCRRYYYISHCVTIRLIISRWAPSTENDTQKYVEWVAAMTGLDPDEHLPLPVNDNEDVWMRVAVAMALYEGGALSSAQLMKVDLWKVMSGWDLYRMEAGKGEYND